jgi:hypothetical protein
VIEGFGDQAPPACGRCNRNIEILEAEKRPGSANISAYLLDGQG